MSAEAENGQPGPESGEGVPEVTPEEQQQLQQEMMEQMAQMFIKDEKHANCPVANVHRIEDGTIDITFQVGHNHFHSYRIAKPGQKAISDAYLAGGGAKDIVVATGPIPPPPDPGAGRHRPRR